MKEKFWLECYVHGNIKTSIIYVDILTLMTQDVLRKLIDKHPNRYASGLYHLAKDEINIIQKLTSRNLDFKNYRYNIVTMHFVKFLQAIKKMPDDLCIEWFSKESNNTTHIKTEHIHFITSKKLSSLLGLNYKNYPFDGICYSVEEYQKNILQKFIKHKLNFKKYHYSISNYSKYINCSQWDKWLPI